MKLALYLTLAAAILTLCYLPRKANAAPKFEKTEMVLGKMRMKVEVADDEPKREYGLMNRSSLGDKAGMIFVFDVPEVQAFWMKDTLIPLSIGFFDGTGTLFQILDMDPVSPMELRPKTYLSAKPAKYALEVNKGWFAKHKISLGTKLKLPHYSAGPKSE